MKKCRILLIVGLVLLSSISSFSQKRSKGGDVATAGMARIPAGSYQPFLKVNNQAVTIKMHSFYLDAHAVTNAEFLEFVKANPQWSRSKVSKLFADGNYLKQWAGDFTIGNDRIFNSPVTNVSWFAAVAYAKWVGKRLPTMEEWEYAAHSAPVNAPKGEKLATIILNWYSRPTPAILPNVESTFKNGFGVYDMHGLVWEWVYDFNSVITGDDSRSSGALNRQLYCAAGSQNAVNKEDYASFMRFAFRESLKANYTVANLGFRCAMDIK
ncbi:MAG: formylglycine-generating enzyme family protein [Chitinophagaceae bacterium]|jgi:formylglycine-generating enzyme required for sulfatase activity|nr:MAG: formylglycine-generating enzyme family protein [Chitinophagaceae bacterium]